MPTFPRAALRPFLAASLACALIAGCHTPPAAPVPPDPILTLASVSELPEDSSAEVLYLVDTAAHARADFTSRPYETGGLRAPGGGNLQVTIPKGSFVTLIAVTNEAPAVEPLKNRADSSILGTGREEWSSWSAPCAVPEPGTCVIKAENDLSLSVATRVQKSVRVSVAGGGRVAVAIDAPKTLGDIAASPRRLEDTLDLFGDPGLVETVALIAPRAATITLEPLAPAGSAPSGSPGPLGFKKWGGACAAADGTCALADSLDAGASLFFEYETCPDSTWSALWKAPPAQGCTLVDP